MTPAFVFAKKPLEVNLMTDTFSSKPDDPLNIATQFMRDIEKQLNGAITLKFISTSKLREWKQIHTMKNVCLYNKTKTPEREKDALFTQYPIMAFPSNRLLVYNHPELPDNVSLNDAVNKYKLTIGIISGRSYGPQIDAYIAKHSNDFMVLGGTTSAYRLSQMLFQNKFDAIIEYSAVFNSRHGNDPRVKNIRKLTIAKTNQAVFGYIACSKSPQGKEAIKLFEQALKTTQIQQRILDGHKRIFSPPEQGRILSILKAAFNVPLHAG